MRSGFKLRTGKMNSHFLSSINIFHPLRLARFLLCLIFSCLLLLPGSYGQTERILNYDTQIEVNTDRSITVTEFIEVYVNGDKIKRGITRRLPKNRNMKGRTTRMDYEILEIEKNGQEEPYHREEHGDIMLYLGSRDVLLQPGTYQYKIKYRVPDQITFWDDYDEIYWNAIGNDVEFEVENASCRVKVPAGARVIQESAYTGRYGHQEDATTMTNEGAFLDYRTDRSLKPREAFTVAVGFEKGFVEEPGFLQRIGALLLVILASIFLLPYYLYTWWKYGQDPPSPTPYPIWNAPDDLSAASIGYINKGRHESKSFTASIVHLAIKGYLKIEEIEKKGFFSKSKNFDLIKLRASDSALPAEERQVFDSLFSGGDRVSITGKYDTKIEKSYLNHKGSLSAQHRSFIIKGHNAKFLVIPILVTIIVFAIAIIFLIKSSYATGANITALIAFAPLAIGGVILYGYLIKKPTPEKLELRSRIKGFEMYLELAEKERLRLLNPPEMTPEHFETVLPYAFALGVEHQWTEKFQNILEQANYRPQWHNSATPLYFSNHFGHDFSQSVSGAATKPSDSGSGSGGGGFSGGGGGGGGVGGW
ncbi:MAG: DUF2207 domain-containing protein [Saprospiraceae bacterium]|nr:DUF2207 domain-containing protein [Saprospiraceae bacterium]